MRFDDGSCDHQGWDSYVLNPVYQAVWRGAISGAYRICELAPDGCFNSAIHKAGYTSPSDTEEIGFVTRSWPRGMEEVDILISLDETVTGEISIYRQVSDGGFSDVDLARLREVYPAVSACLQVYWRGCHDSIPNTADQGVPADAVLDNLGAMRSARREREVIRLVLGAFFGVDQPPAAYLCHYDEVSSQTCL